MHWLPLIAFSLFSIQSFAADSPLCENLSRFSCAPGSYDDGTGKVKSEEEIEKKLAEITAKFKNKFQDRWKKELAQEKNSHFRNLALAALGLKNSPDCQATEQARQTRCTENLAAGLSKATSTQVLGTLKSNNPLGRAGNFKESGFLIYQELFQEIRKEFQTDLRKELNQSDYSEKVKNKVFPQVQSLIIKKLQELPISDQNRKAMIDKIKNIRFKGNNCSNENKSPGVDNLLVPNAFYNPGADTIELCNGFLFTSSSEFTIANIIGHELAHAIDPCQIDYGPADMGFHYSKNSDLFKKAQEYPIPNIITCLRNEKSVEAKRSSLEMTTFSNGTGVMVGGTGIPPIPPPPVPKNENFCTQNQTKDQIGEAFCDWLAAEVTPQYIQNNFKLTDEQYRIGYSNVWRSLCATEHESHGGEVGTHPKTEDRVDRILLQNPQMRAQMKCSKGHSEYIYCDPKNPPATTGTTENKPVEKPIPKLPQPGVK